MNNLITVLGPTATGKTTFAAKLAEYIGGEIISADSRQVYRYMDIGTGKDIQDYVVNGKLIPHHLIDIVDPGYEYNVYEFQKDFRRVFQDIKQRGKRAILCGGTGMYLEAVLKAYELIKVPENQQLKLRLREQSNAELIKELGTYRNLHNTTDTGERDRLIRALEIEHYYAAHPNQKTAFPAINSLNIGIWFERKVIRERITQRLKNRLENGMVEEVKELLNNGVSSATLQFYGLEYRYLTQYVIGEIDYSTMFSSLNTAIHQFAKRQMTWFRRMERKGITIHWIDGEKSTEAKIAETMALIEGDKES